MWMCGARECAWCVGVGVCLYVLYFVSVHVHDAILGTSYLIIYLDMKYAY